MARKTTPADSSASLSDSSSFQALRWRCIGPPRGGRVVAVSGDPVNRMVFYFGACAGGIWKTEDGGVFWRNVSDGYMSSAAVEPGLRLWRLGGDGAGIGAKIVVVHATSPSKLR